MKIVQVEPESELLDKVIELGDKNSNTLGILAKSIYQDYAKKGEILAVVTEYSELAGYLIYYYAKTKDWYSIQHFCIAPEFRGRGMSEMLFDELKERSKVARWIKLSCRDDYKHAIKLWKRLGFVPHDIVQGRSKKTETYKIIWLYTHQKQNQTLFDILPANKLALTIDACIFYDFMSNNPDNVERESLSLLQDWLYPEVEIVITPELKQEINRIENPHIRKRYLEQARNYVETNADEKIVREIYNELSLIMPIVKRPNDESDLWHISWSIADKNVNSFVTRDERILQHSEEISQKFGFLIQRPIDLLLSIDEQIRLEEYRIMRFAGTDFTMRRVQAKEEDYLAQAFQYDFLGEKKSQFLNILRESLINRENTTSYVVENQNDEFVALFVYDNSIENELQIPIFRVNVKCITTSIVRYLLLKFITMNIGETNKIIRVTETRLHEIIETALREDMFYQNSDNWIKVTLPFIDNSISIADKFENALENDSDAKKYFDLHINILKEEDNLKNIEAMTTIERLLLPAVITNSNIQTISIPILPVWAAAWFDEELAKQTLFGANNERAFNREGVYYSKKKIHVDLPARVVWYVTQEKRNSIIGDASIRAFSKLDNVVTGKVKDLFKQFKNLGIYDISDIKNQFQSLEQEITAYRFSDTVLFPKPISYSNWENITSQITGNRPPIYSPAKMPIEVFEQIYKEGMI